MKENDLLGSPQLHGRLYLSSCILAELLKRSPAALHTAQLAEEAGHPQDEVEQMCSRLYHNGLLQRDAGGGWRLAGDPASMTLADLFSALLLPPNGQNSA